MSFALFDSINCRVWSLSSNCSCSILGNCSLALDKLPIDVVLIIDEHSFDGILVRERNEAKASWL